MVRCQIEKSNSVPKYALPFLIGICIVLTLSYTIQAQSVRQDSIQGPLNFLQYKITDYAESHPVEKVYIHFDRSYYVLGEDSWFKAYVVNGGDFSPTDISGVLYVDWIDPFGTVIRHQRLKIENGSAPGDFKFNKEFPAGSYTVRAYTHWMRNEDPSFFYSKPIRVIDPRVKSVLQRKDSMGSKIDFQFFPEGGTLVSGIKTQMAFKAIDGYGRGVQVKGKIVDENGKLVTTIQSSHRGMGVFPFIGDAGKLYKVVLDRGETFSVPSPSDKGITLAASNMEFDRLLVRVQATAEYKSSVVSLIVHSRGQVYHFADLRMAPQVKTISISKNELPEGIVYITLFSDGLPQCERKVFIKKESKVTVNIAANKKKYAPRDSVSLLFKVQGIRGVPVKTSLSVSVTDADYAGADDSENIYTSLLLQSDLKGYIENPAWYFERMSAERSYALDLVMLTHGWSRYNWNKILQHSPDTLSFAPEKGMTLRGQISANGKPVANLPFTLVIPQAGKKVFSIYETDSLGHFEIPDIDFTDSTLVAWRVLNKRRAILNARVRLEEKIDLPAVRIRACEAEDGEELFDKISDRYIKYGIWNLDNVTLLREVVIEAKKTAIIGVTRLGMILKPDSISVKNRVSTGQYVSRYAMRLPFATPQRTADGEDVWGIITKGKFSPVQVIVDGFVQESAGGPLTILNSIPIEDIEYIAMGGSGLMVKTKDQSLQGPSGSIELICNGYDGAREFYHPKYGPSDVTATGADNRTTLYWNAGVQTDESGTAVIKFYNSDAAKKFRIASEGIVNGTVVSSTVYTGDQ